MDFGNFATTYEDWSSVAMRKMSVVEDFIVECLFRVSRSFWLFCYLIGVSAKLDAYLDFSIVTTVAWVEVFTALLYRLFASGIVF